MSLKKNPRRSRKVSRSGEAMSRQGQLPDRSDRSWGMCRQGSKVRGPRSGMQESGTAWSQGDGTADCLPFSSSATGEAERVRLPIPTDGFIADGVDGPGGAARRARARSARGGKKARGGRVNSLSVILSEEKDLDSSAAPQNDILAGT